MAGQGLGQAKNAAVIAARRAVESNVADSTALLDVASQVSPSLWESLAWASARLLLGCLVVWVVMGIGRRSVLWLTARTRTETDDYILRRLFDSLIPITYLAVARWAWDAIPLTEDAIANRILFWLVPLVITVLLVRWVNASLTRLLQAWVRGLGDTELFTSLDSMVPMLRAFVWVLGILIYLQNRDVQLGAVFATLAAAGIGIGIALRGPVEDFFTYLTILFDRPFRIGDFIIFEEYLGAVETIGIRSSRIRALGGEVIAIKNSELLAKTVRNFAALERRRRTVIFGVTYQTPAALIEAIPQWTREIVEATPDSEFDRCYFISFGASSLDFELVFYVPMADLVVALKAQQQIQLGMMRYFEAKGVEFAYPTQTLFIEKGN